MVYSVGSGNRMGGPIAQGISFNYNSIINHCIIGNCITGGIFETDATVIRVGGVVGYYIAVGIIRETDAKIIRVDNVVGYCVAVGIPIEIDAKDVRAYSVVGYCVAVGIPIEKDAKVIRADGIVGYCVAVGIRRETDANEDVRFDGIVGYRVVMGFPERDAISVRVGDIAVRASDVVGDGAVLDAAERQTCVRVVRQTKESACVM